MYLNIISEKTRFLKINSTMSKYKYERKKFIIIHNISLVMIFSIVKHFYFCKYRLA